MTAALSIVSALHAARNRGVGQSIRVPMVEAMMTFTCNDTMVGYTFVPEDEYKDQAPKSQSLDPFPTRDGWISIAPFTDEQFERLCAGVGHQEWWSGVPDRTERVRGILRGLAKTLPERTTAEWLEVLEKADVPVGRVNDYESLFTDQEVVANENFTLYEHPDAGTVRTVNHGARFSETPARMWRTPPRLGENTEEVLRELGVERSTIEELRRDKVINS
jgi:formyl-CoA transferase